MSTPHCSFVIYLFRDFATLPIFLQDFRSFFKKFPLRYELICVMDSEPPENFLNDLQKNAPENESWQFIQSQQKSGRAQGLQRGMSQAHGEFIILPSTVMATPLGDLFKILQHLMTDPTLDACWGERYSKKPEQITHSVSSSLRLENLFNKILKEKNPQASTDPLCEIGGIRNSSWKKIESSVILKNKNGWFLAGSCQKALRENNLHQSFLYIHDSGKRSSDFSTWQARWELLRQSLFQTL